MKNSKFPFIVKIVFFVMGFICVERFCHNQTEGFRVRKITSTLSYNSQWDIPPLAPEEESELKKMLTQPFYFLGSGGQCYAFLSADDKYVLKFFKHHHMRKDHWLNSFNLNGKWDLYRKKIAGGGEKRQRELFTSFKIAYDMFKEETGLIYVHLNKTQYLNKTLTLVDKIGIAHQVDLDEMEFALQRKAEPLLPVLQGYIREKNLTLGKQVIDSFLSHVQAKCEKGINDNDPVIFRNFGIFEGKVMEIDLGSFSRDDFLKQERRANQEIFFESQDLIKWLDEESPELSCYLSTKVNTLLCYD